LQIKRKHIILPCIFLIQSTKLKLAIMLSKVFGLALAAFALIVFSHCASIVHGPSLKVDFASQPAGAKITIDGNYYGQTPKTIPLRRKGRLKGEAGGKKEYEVKLELPGYYPYEIKLKREMDGWFLGNLLFGGLIGIVIDAGNGSMYKLTPDQIVGQLGKTEGSTGMKSEKDNIYVFATLKTDPTWEKIGVLKKIAE